MKLAISRLLATGGALALTTGLALALAPAAQADPGPVLTNPRMNPIPVNAGVSTNGCEGVDTGTGWLSAGSQPEFLVDVPADYAGSKQPRFRVLDVTGPDGIVVLDQEAPVAYGVARVGVADLLDGHSYAWRAQLPGGQGRAVTPLCHFQVDTTAPTTTVSSTDFPAAGSNKFAGEKGTFTLAGTDPAPAGGAASGVACFRPVLDGSVSVFKCGDPGTVLPGADGTANVVLRPGSWGPNTLTVQTMDNAGNVSVASYSFYAPWNPNPPQAQGDVDNDAVPDILLPDAAGNLQVISGNAGSTTPTTTVAAVNAPGGQGTWAGVQLAHRGWDNTNPADTVFAHRDGNLYAYRNTGTLNLNSGGLVRRPSSCADANEVQVACPAGYATDWSGVEQLVALGQADKASATRPWLLTVEQGNLWLYGNGNLLFGREKAQQLTTSGNWSNFDLVAPGADAKGNLSLWARDRATGELHVYPLPMQASGIVDFSALADPSAHGVGAVFTTAAFPTLGSSGDLDGDGTPDLWAVTADRHLQVFRGYQQPKDWGLLK
ncbi:hypothetical protein C7C46_17490 [Streptomyces tateyamensis]|uniref:VCBS repeat-containing protein n=1 Tax=Streptomyces tateyamensis TaxID=565073 RepID=A0A2V4N2D2_9ACTN|nr:hypothetical protein [Streptomyces tateyamensis]PYC78120.1 hypothetical protein C7C46_17490 [Streptomyces tateyamensis]